MDTEGASPEHPHSDDRSAFRLSRRGFLGTAGGVAAGAAGFGAASALHLGGAGGHGASASATQAAMSGTEPFYGLHQGGVATSPQAHTYFAALDVTTERRSDLVDLLRSWTETAAALVTGARAPSSGPNAADSGETLGLGPARLTVNFGFGPSLFGAQGSDRFGLARAQPWQLVDLPPFPGDQLDPAETGGDLSVHACANDPQVAFHAVRLLLRQARGAARLRWWQSGFNETVSSDGTPRNLMGFKDGTMNPGSEASLDQYVWVGAEGPDWMRGGSYLVVRRIRMALGAWDGQSVAQQERVIGRHKASGAPLGKTSEFDALDLRATDAAGSPVIPVDAHVRLAAPSQNWDSVILRRGYAYVNADDAPGEADASSAGEDELDAGLLFCSYQRNPRLSFVPIYRRLSHSDALRRFTAHTASAVFALPPAAPHPGLWVGQALLAT